MMRLKIFLVKIRQIIGVDLLMRLTSDYFEKRWNATQEINPAKISNGWSFVIVTNGNSMDTLGEQITSIETEMQNSLGEIIIVGPPDLRLKMIPKIDCQLIPFRELGWAPGWITFKKNLGVKAAKYDKIVVCHDYIKFEPGWKAGFDGFGENWDVCVNKIVNLDGKRNRDWLVWDYPGLNAPGLLPYSAECSQFQILSGAYYVGKRKFLIENPLNETLRWGEAEDVEWSKRIRTKIKFKFNLHSAVKFLRLKKSLPENWITSTEQLKHIFEKP